MQAPDGQKGHEPQFWAVLRFDEEGNVLPIEWVDEMTLVRRNALGSAEVRLEAINSQAPAGTQDMKLPQHPASLKTDDVGVTVPTVHGFGSDRAEELAAKEIQRLWVSSTILSTGYSR